MKKYTYSFHVEEKYDTPVTRHSFLLRCTPGTYPFQRSYAHKFTIKPFAPLTYSADVFHNEISTGTIDKKHSSFSFTASGFVLSSKYLIHEPLDRLFLYPTASTQPNDGMHMLIEHADLPCNDWSRAKVLCMKTASLLSCREVPGCRTAAEVFTSGYGNSMEIAQVFVCLCRRSGLAARYVSGLAAGITKPHAWVEVYSDHCWRALDPSTGNEVTDGYLKIAHGVDYGSAELVRSCCHEAVLPSSYCIEVSVTEHVVLTRDTVPHA